MIRKYKKVGSNSIMSFVEGDKGNDYEDVNICRIAFIADTEKDMGAEMTEVLVRLNGMVEAIELLSAVESLYRPGYGANLPETLIEQIRQFLEGATRSIKTPVRE